MTLKCLASGSRGNCYLLISPTDTLIIEAGIRFSEIKAALNFDLSKAVGCIVSHKHNDHARCVVDMLNFGIRTLALKDVFESKGVAEHPFAKHVLPNHGYVIGGFKVYCFLVSHDVPCLAFIIDHPDMGRTIFVTDTMLLEYQIPSNTRHLMLECNYADDILQHNIDTGKVLKSMRERLMYSHMELETCKGIVRATDMTQVSEIVLLHLSDGNSNADRFAAEIESISGKPVHIAAAGLEIDYSTNPY